MYTVSVNVVDTERLAVGTATLDCTELATSELPLPVVPKTAFPPPLLNTAVSVVAWFKLTRGAAAVKDVIAGRFTTFTVVELDFVGSATDVAVIVYVAAEDGAVQIAPDHEPAPPELQVTAVLTAFCAEAVKACVPPVVT